ncbi:hypothetical protein K492DRAFT_200594 [Lichtheimia hyalospora FSU 10163]|nr:hypothetical protein K492DRAFT_200594 [Lichtheimia hyalospora FSU 10163]
MPATCDRHCQALAPCEDEEEYQKYKIGIQRLVHPQRLVRTIGKHQHHIKMKKNMRNTRLDQRQLVSTIDKQHHHVKMKKNMGNASLDYKTNAVDKKSNGALSAKVSRLTHVPRSLPVYITL